MLIIDANNLAGKLNLLKEKKFDERLIEMIKGFNKKKRKIVLVFDGIDIMGDRYTEDWLTVIRTPKDSFYKNADDKIAELIMNTKEDSTLVTDDLELIEKAKELKLKFIRLKIKRATDFAKEIIGEEEMEDEKEMDGEETDKINNELLKIWKK